MKNNVGNHVFILSIFDDTQPSILRWYVDLQDGTQAQEVRRSQVDDQDFFECACGGNYKWSPPGYEDWCLHIREVCLRLVVEQAMQGLLETGVIRHSGRYSEGRPLYQLTPESELTDRARAERKRLGWDDDTRPENCLTIQPTNGVRRSGR